MPFVPPAFLAPVDAMRPVFLILMGASLLLIAWRLSRRHSGWGPRLMMGGALMLAIGYSVVLLLYTAQAIVPLSHLQYYPDADPAAALGWHMLKVGAMNGGWLFFGLGLALYVGVFESLSRPVSSQTPKPLEA